MHCCELCLDRLVVGHALRVLAFCDADDLLRSLELLLLHYLEVADHVDCRIRGDQRELVELLVFKEDVGDLDDALLAMDLAGEVDADRDLALDVLQVKEVQCLIYVFCRDVVQYGTVLQCAYY